MTELDFRYKLNCFSFAVSISVPNISRFCVRVCLTVCVSRFNVLPASFKTAVWIGVSVVVVYNYVRRLAKCALVSESILAKN